MKIISLDTSTTCTGWCVYENGEYSTSGCIDLKKSKLGTFERMDQMCLILLGYLDAERPDVVVAETTVVTRNAEAQRNLTMILGVIYGWCIKNGKKYAFLRPTEWRKYAKNDDEKVPKKREELKAWSIARCKELFNKEVKDDEADSILIGYAYTKMEV